MAINVSDNWKSTKSVFLTLHKRVEERLTSNKKNLPPEMYDFISGNLEDIFFGLPDTLASYAAQYVDTVDACFASVPNNYSHEYLDVFAKAINLVGGYKDYEKADDKFDYLKQKVKDVELDFSCFSPVSLNYSGTIKDNIEKLVLKAVEKEWKSDLNCDDFIKTLIPNLNAELHKIYTNTLASKIGSIFNYKDEIDTCGYDLCNKINVRVCPYCNLSFANHFNDDKGKFRPDFDHYYPKSTYPILSLSWYNLIPSCKQCNSMKNDKDFLKGEYFHPLKNEKEIEFSVEVNVPVLWSGRMTYSPKSINIKIDGNANLHGSDSINKFFLRERYDLIGDEIFEICLGMLNYRDLGAIRLLSDADRIVMRGVNESNYKRRIMGKLIFDLSKKLM